MRIALFTDSFDQENGVSTTYQNILKELYGKDIIIDVYVYHDPTKDLKDMEMNSNISIFRFKPKVPIRYYQDLQLNLFCNDNYVYYSFSLYHDYKPYDLIHITSCGGMSQIGFKISKQYKIPLVAIYHTDLVRYVKHRYGTLASKIAKYLTKIVYNKCELIMVPSQAYADEISRFINTEIRILKRGVDTSLFSPKKGNPKGEVPIILYAGRLSVEKNIPMLIDTYRSLEVEAKLQIIGKGPLYDELKNQSDIEVIPYMDKEKLARYYASATVFAFPSLTDVFGNVILESLSSGTPCVVMDQGGPKEIVKHGVTGYIAHNESEFKKYIERICTDDNHRMSEEGRKYALSQSWNNIARKLIENYSHIIT